MKFCMGHRTWIEIHERAFAQNLNALRSLLRPEAKFCAMVKGNAYGHRMLPIVSLAVKYGVNYFGVDEIEDAIKIRRVFPNVVIIVFGYTIKENLIQAIDKNIQLTVYDKETIQTLHTLTTQKGKPVSIHLKIDTGTSRQGILLNQLKDYLDLLRTCPLIQLEGISTHFANVEQASDPSYSNLQFERFLQAKTSIFEYGFSPKYVHLACSAALILYPDTHQTLVRVGISLYGFWPSVEVEQVIRRQHIDLNLEPILSWKTRIAQVKRLSRGTPIGYGLTEILKQDSHVAILPVGYWDGFDRSLSSCAEVLIGGHRCRVLGRVCMNMMMVDVSLVPHLEPEQEVVLLGRQGRYSITAEDLAQKIGTISYEVLTRINPLLPRVIIAS